jgi:ankyrin repeat protein
MQIKKPFPKTGTSYVQNIHYQNPEIDLSLIPKLFLLISEGNISEANIYADTNNLSYSTLDENGNSLLHLLINSSISKYDKLNILRYLANNGTRIDQANKFGVVPLHLASQHHYADIVEFLLKKKANVNAVDSKQKNSLHYACMMKQTGCPPKSISEKPLRPMYKPSKNNELYTDLAKELYGLMATNINILRYLQHIYDSLDDLYLFDDIKKNLKKEILSYKEEILSHKNVDLKNKVILEKANSLYNTVAQKLKAATDNLEFSIDNTGWGPDMNTKIMNIISEKTILSAGNEKLVSTLRDLDNKYTKYAETIERDINTINTVLTNFRKNIFPREGEETVFVGIQGILDPPFFQHSRTETIEGEAEGEGDEERYVLSVKKPNLFLIDRDQILEIDNPNIYSAIEYYIFMLQSSFNEIKGSMNEIFVDIQGNNFGSIFLLIGNTIVHFLSLMTTIVYLQDELSILKTSTISIIEELNRNISDLNADLNLGMFSGIIRQELEKYINNDNELKHFRDVLNEALFNYMKQRADEQGIRLNRDANITYKYLFLRGNNPPLLPGELIDDFKEIMKNAGYSDEVEEGEQYSVIENTVYDIEQIMNDRAPENIYTLKQPNENIVQYLNYIFYLRNIKNLISDDDDGLNKIKLNELYVKIKTLFDHLKHIVSYINDFSGYKFINIFFNNFKNGYFIDQNTDEFKGMYETPFKEFPKIPSSLNDFAALIGTTSVQYAKKILFENFVPQIHSNHDPIYIFKQTPNEDEEDGTQARKDGFYIGELIGIDLPNLFDETDPPKLKSTVLQYGHNTTKLPFTQEKKAKTFLTTNSFIDTHFKLIKISIIMFIINELHTEHQRQILPITALYDKMKKIIRELNLGENIGLIYVIIGKLVNNIISKYISTLAYNSSIGYMYNQLEIPMALPLELALTFDESIIKSVNVSYEEFLTSFARQKIDFFEDVEEKVEEKVQEQNDDTIYTKNNVCFEYNTKTIGLLLDYGVNINKKDLEGNTPIYYAVDMSNFKIVNELIKRSASVYHSKNIYKYSAYDYISINFKNLLDIMNPQDILDSYNTQTATEIENKTSKVTKLRFTNIIFPWTYYLIEHLLTNRYRSYLSGWTHHDKIFLQEILNINPNQYIPFLDSRNFTGIEVQHNSSYLALLKKKKEDIINIINNLQEEQNDIFHPITQNRRLEITNEITKLRTDLRDVDIKQHNTEIINTPISYNVQNRFTNLIVSPMNNNVVEIYNEIFKKLEENILYTKIWSVLLKNPEDELNILKKLNKYLSNTDIKNINFKLIIKYLEKAKIFINDYFDLPKVYSLKENYALYYVMQIISHVIRHTILINFISVLNKGITEYVRIAFAQKPINTISDQLKKIFSEQNVTNLLLNSDKFVKIILNIFEDENDEDKNMSDEVVLENCMKIFFINPHLSINDTNDIYVDTKKTLIPYFLIYTRTYIIKTKEMIDKIFYSILELLDLLKILKIIKSQTEIEERLA